jgi:nicotinamide mononucleotide transporter
MPPEFRLPVTEIAGSILGAIAGLFLIRRSIWSYPFGIAMVGLYALVFFRARLYSDAALQLFFLAVQLYGWTNWAANRAQRGTVTVRRMTAREIVLWTVIVATAAAGDYWFLVHHTRDAAPLLDALITAFSIAAQSLLAIRRLENWIAWIIVDGIGIALYLSQHLFTVAGVYLIFLGLSVAGLVAWRRAWQAQQATSRATG